MVVTNTAITQNEKSLGMHADRAVVAACPTATFYPTCSAEMTELAPTFL